MEKELTIKIENYIAELDHLTTLLNSMDFPCSDAALVYSEVSKKLKSILGE